MQHKYIHCTLVSCSYLCLSIYLSIYLFQISFYFYITYTKSFHKVYSNLKIFTVTKKLLLILLYNKENITTGTTRHYLKHMNNVKFIHTKETILISFLLKQSPKSNSTEICYKSTQYTQRGEKNDTLSRKYFGCCFIDIVFSFCCGNNEIYN